IKESVAVPMPIFIGFLFSHVVLIVWGIASHGWALPEMVGGSIAETASMARSSGWTAVAALLLLSYSLGGGTYTGIEAVSNNIHTLAEPRIRTGRVTMMYMAGSLAFIAAGILLLYLLWNIAPGEGKQLNALAFRAITDDVDSAGRDIGASG